MITWNIHIPQGLSHDTAISDVLVNGTVQAAFTSSTSFRLAHGGNAIVFDGTFTTDPVGILTGGTITGFQVYYGAAELLDASGYAIDVDDFLSGSSATAAGSNLLVQVSKTINGSAQDDVATGRTQIDEIFGNEGNDTINGDLGDDFISGGAGMDTLTGGDATPVLQDGTDTVDYSEKTGALVITLTDDVVTTVRVNGVAEDTIVEFENAIGGSGNDRITGGEVANRLVGNGGDDILDGGRGADTLIGGLGNDIYLVDNPADMVAEAAGQGIDTVQASVSYTLGSGVENLILFGASALNGAGNAFANTIVGNDGNNVLDGGLGADTMIGGLGDDNYVVGTFKDVATEKLGEGADTVNASVSFALGANLENLVLTGASAKDGTGNGLANAISGNAAANVLAGGLGLDLLTGGEGSDTFVFDTKLGKANVDTITDFATGFDRIGLDADIFRKVNDAGKLKAKFFADGKAHDGNDYIIFKEKSGALYYDKDGEGGRHHKLFAKLDAHLDLDAGDFFVV